MNKTQLIDTVAGKTGQSKAQTAKYLDALLATLATSLADGEPVQLIGFGSFSLPAKAAIPKPANRWPCPQRRPSSSSPAKH